MTTKTFVLWTEQQATLLRRRAAGELINDAELDWQNIAEEIEAQRGAIRAASCAIAWRGCSIC